MREIKLGDFLERFAYEPDEDEDEDDWYYYDAFDIENEDDFVSVV